MSRSVVAVGGTLVLLGLAVFYWKAIELDLPVLPSQASGLWQVEMELAVRGYGEAGSVHLALPVARPGQRIFSEWWSAADLTFSERSADSRRVGIWSGSMEETHRIVYVFQVERYPVDVPSGDVALEPPPESMLPYTRASVTLPAKSPRVADVLSTLELPSDEDRSGRVRTLFAFARHEIAGVPDGSDDALLTLAQRSGSEHGRVRALVTLLRAIGVPARVEQGLLLKEGRAEPRVWAQIWWNRDWISASPSAGFFGRLPLDWVSLGASDGPIVERTGVQQASLHVEALHDQLTGEEVNAMMVPSNPFWERLSLYRLSVSTQAALRILLIMPVAALLISFLRNVVGIPSYGTFMPILIAMALRGTGLALGLLLVLMVIGVGVLGRLALGRLRLLLVPRLSVLLCLVILCVTTLALAGRSFETRDFYAGIVFPIVILTMLIERFSVVLAEEGMGEALSRAGWSTLMAMAVYPLFRMEWLTSLMFGFPELVLCVMGALVLLGGYTGYRVTDWLRFRALAADAEERA